MRKQSFLLCLGTVVALCFSGMTAVRAAEAVSWQGTVTGVDSNGNRPGRSFTAVDANGQVKMFYISSLAHLDKGDRVELHYLPGKTFPLNVTRIRFLQPEN